MGSGGSSSPRVAAREGDLRRITTALAAVEELLRGRPRATGKVEHKEGDDPVTATDRAIDALLLQALPRQGEGWLSEETADDGGRLTRSRVWVVDPLDGTREFVAGIPEWCVSVGLVEDGEAVAGGILNPATGQLFLGSVETGITLGGVQVRASAASSLSGAVVLASRSEVRRGEWERFRDAPFTLRPVGSVAYKLALVAAGLADATWTLVRKHEWDVAAGVALARAAGCAVYMPDGAPPTFNHADPVLPGLLCHPQALREEILATIGLAA